MQHKHACYIRDRLQSRALIIIIALLSLIPCINILYSLILGENIAWLMEAARRLLDGKNLLQNIYETNPPLSILLYTPFVFFSEVTGLTGHQSIFFLIITFSLVFAWLLLKILDQIEILDTVQKNAIIFAYFVGLFCIPNIYFAERENIMTIAIIPFFLAQYCITKKIILPSYVLYTVLIFGSIALLIKPHFGILPTLVFGHRLITQRRLSIVFDKDFLILSIITSIYLVILYTFFYNYLVVIFPDVIRLYITITDDYWLALRLSPYIMGCIVLIVTESLLEDLSKDKRFFVIGLYIASLICFIPALIQMKGYYYHLLPGITFLLCGLSLSFTIRAKFIPCKLTYSYTPLLLMCLLLYFSLPKVSDYPKVQNIKSMPFGVYLSENCPNPCTFFMFHSSLSVFHPTAFYMGLHHGSRFPVYWFLPSIVNADYAHKNNLNSQLSLEETQNLKKRYTQYALDDLKNYEPSIILLVNNISIAGDEYFNYVDFFSESIKFKEYFSAHYSKTGSFKMDQSLYFKDTDYQPSPHIFEYDVYTRKDSL